MTEFVSSARERVDDFVISPAFWRTAVKRDNCLAVCLSRIAEQAIADALWVEPRKLPVGRFEAFRYRERKKHKASAMRWLYNDLDDELNFSCVCDLFDIDVDIARFQILAAILLGVNPYSNSQRHYSGVGIVVMKEETWQEGKRWRRRAGESTESTEEKRR